MKFLLLLLITTNFTYAQIPDVLVRDFNFSYRDPQGEGRAAAFHASGYRVNSGAQVWVQKISQDFQFRVSGKTEAEFLFTGAPNFMTEAERMTIDKLNLNFDHALSLQVRSASFESYLDAMTMQELSLNCNRDRNTAAAMDQLLMGCLQRLSLKSKRFTQSGLQSLLSGVLAESLAGTDLSNLELKILSGRYELATDVKAQLSGKVRSKGTISYNEKTKVLKIQISEVKFSILNITHQVFDELKRRESDRLKVQKPFLYLTLQ